LLLMSQIQTTTSMISLSLWMLVVGAGIGMFMQVMTLAVQNALPHRDLGTATSTVTFFRSMGSSFGTSIFGSILASRFAVHLASVAPAGSLPKGAAVGQSALNSLSGLPPAALELALRALTDAFSDIFLYAVPVVGVAFVIALFLREVPLRTEVREQAEYEPVGM